MKRPLAAFAASIALMSCAARAAGPEDIEKLKVLAGGAWTCAGTQSDGKMSWTARHQYLFNVSGPWMQETTDAVINGKPDHEIQMWGYDSEQDKLVAYMFIQPGVHQKNVDGWVDGDFVSHSISPAYDVKLHVINSKHMQWLITSPQLNQTEDCKR